jgi:NAD(P)-dependent dehydrogenase (short-subunit alcohol dehydrogenase family)
MFNEMSKSDQSEVINAIPLGRMPALQECVDPVLFLASNESSYITGTVLDVNGGRLMPN